MKKKETLFLFLFSLYMYNVKIGFHSFKSIEYDTRMVDERTIQKSMCQFEIPNMKWISRTNIHLKIVTVNLDFLRL